MDIVPSTPSTILEGVERIGWGISACQCFAGAVASIMRYLSEPVTDDYIMGISGGAFLTIWGMPWSPANCDMLVATDEVIFRTFDALGYGYTHINRYEHDPDTDWKETFRSLIVRSIDQGYPVVGKGIVGPQECCVVFGYEDGGKTLYGWSYYQIVNWFYQGDPSRPFKKEDPYADCYGLILVHEKRPFRPSPQQVLRESLAWAIRLARIPEYISMSGGKPVCFKSGLAAYDAMEQALLRDEDFPADNMDVLSFRAQVLANDGLPLIKIKRDAAVSFLTEMAAKAYPGADELRRAASLYARQAALLKPTETELPLSYAPVEEKLKLADCSFRKKVASLVHKARGIEEQAVEALEAAFHCLDQGN